MPSIRYFFVLSRVIQRKTIKLSDNSEVIETYSYNSAGNLCTACGNESFRYDASNKLTEFNGKPVTYDADGNMLEASTGKFTYDSANRLITADTRYYVYDVEGTRIKTQKGEDTTKFTYNVNARLSQLLVKTENNAVTKYIYGLGLIGEEVSGSFKTYHFDYRGSTVAITNASGTVTDTFTYDTYGKLTARTGTTKTPFLYNGRDGVMYEEDTGLIYMRARYYSPILRRFVNADKVHGDITNALSLNRYAFVNGNPAVNVDPEGLKGVDARGGSKGDGTYWTVPDPNVVYYYGNPYATGGIPKWLSGTLNIVGGTLEMFAGAALGATLGWTGVGSLFAGLLVVDGAGRTTQGIAQTSNDITNSNTFYEGNIPKELVKDAGRTIAGDTGAMLAGSAYDASINAIELFMLYESVRGLVLNNLARFRATHNTSPISTNAIYPPNNGAVEGTEVTVTLNPGEVYTRYGGTSSHSRYLTEYGADPQTLSLLEGTDTSICDNFIIKQPIKDVTRSVIAPWNGSPGGGYQYILPKPILEYKEQLFLGIYGD